MEEMVFDTLEPTTVKVRIGTTPYILHEALEEAVVRYRNAQMRSARMENGEVVGVDGAGNVEPLLVSMCLYRADAEGNLPLAGNKPDPKALVPLQEINRWRASIVGSLFDKIKEISDLDQDTEDKLIKQMEVLDKKLARLRKAKATEARSLPAPSEEGQETPFATAAL